MTELGERLVDAITAVTGVHPGYRVAHAQGVCATGTFTATAAAARLSRAAHFSGAAVPATVRFSNGNGDPERADTRARRARHRGEAAAADGSSTDLVGLSLPVFFVRTVDDFLAFSAARDPGSRDRRAGSGADRRVHRRRTRSALPAVQATLEARPPASYVTIPYFGIHAFRFVNAAGASRFVRYRWEPDAAVATLTDDEVAAASPSYLADELAARLGAGPASFTLVLQLAERRRRPDRPDGCVAGGPGDGRRRHGSCSTPSPATSATPHLRSDPGGRRRRVLGRPDPPRPVRGLRRLVRPPHRLTRVHRAVRRGAPGGRARRVGAMTSTTMSPDDRYTIISADCHAGASHEMYREYLEKKYLDDFDAWREKYKNPFRDLQDGGRVRNWDDERRIGDEERDGIVAEVVFPNTVPPFFPSFILFARPPTADEYEHRLAGIRAHNRWMADWCARFPERRAGIGQIFLNDVDDAIEDVKWIKEHGLRGGVLISAVAPDIDYIKPLYDPVYDPLWKVCEDLEVPVNSHGGTGLPELRQVPGRRAALHHRGVVLLAAAVRAAAVLGRVRALPEAEVRDDRDGLRVAAADAAALRPAARRRSRRPGAPARCGTRRSTSCRSPRPSTSSRTATSA